MLSPCARIVYWIQQVPIAAHSRLFYSYSICCGRSSATTTVSPAFETHQLRQTVCCITSAFPPYDAAKFVERCIGQVYRLAVKRLMSDSLPVSLFRRSFLRPFLYDVTVPPVFSLVPLNCGIQCCKRVAMLPLSTHSSRVVALNRSPSAIILIRITQAKCVRSHHERMLHRVWKEKLLKHFVALSCLPISRLVSNDTIMAIMQYM